MPRKWHPKTRNGCQTCRSRKIKCDEKHPACLNCIRRGLQCSFLQISERPAPTIANIETLNLELLHHFTISTAATLNPDPQIRELWRSVIPQMAFSTGYVLDGILALSALHIARYNTRRAPSLVPYAIERHSLSLSRALPLIPVVTPQNSPALFVFGVLTLFFNLARPIQESDVPYSNNNIIPEWLYLIRGIDTVAMAESSILSSPVSLIFRTTWGSRDYWKSHIPEKYPVLAELEGRICEDAMDEEKNRILRDAIASLRRSYSFLYGRDFKDQEKLRGFYIWLDEVNSDFLDLLKDRDNGALCVLAFYTVLIRELEKYWWMEGWAIHLIRRIYMLLDGEHRLWIRWAIEEIGWVPDISAWSG